MPHTYSNIGVIVMTDGFLYSKTADELLQATKGFRIKWFFCHRKHEEDAYLDTLLRAFDDKTISHYMIVEHDMMIPPDAVSALLKADKDLAFYNYPYDSFGSSTTSYDGHGNIKSFGVGLMMIKAEALEKLLYQIPEPFTIVQDNLIGIEYWGDCQIYEMPKVVGRRKLKELGKSGTNNGAHKVRELQKVDRRRQFNGR